MPYRAFGEIRPHDAPKTHTLVPLLLDISPQPEIRRSRMDMQELQFLSERADLVVREFSRRRVAWIDARHEFVPESWAGWPKSVIKDCFLLEIVLAEPGSQRQSILQASLLSVSNVRAELREPIGSPELEQPPGAAVRQASIIEYGRALEEWLPVSKLALAEAANLLAEGREAGEIPRAGHIVPTLVARIAAYARKGII